MATPREHVLALPFPLTRGETIAPAWRGYWVGAGASIAGGALGVDDATVRAMARDGGPLTILGDTAHKNRTDRLL